MLRRFCAFALAVPAAIALNSGSAVARPTLDVSARRLAFFVGELGIIARGDADIVMPNGLHLAGTAAYLDLVHDRVVVAGEARATNGPRSVRADAIAYDGSTQTVDVLDAGEGARRSTVTLATFVSVPIESDRFDFPDLDKRGAYIRAHRAEVTAHANVRFAPAAFPNSPGALPVPSYLYTYATNPSFGANALGGATFDQPYGIIGGTTSLLAAHFRYEDGTGPTLALDDHHVYGDNAYVVTSLDSVQRNSRVGQLSAYQRMGARFTQTLAATTSAYGNSISYGLTAALGRSSAQFTLARYGRFSTADLSARTPDRPLFGGVTYRLRADLGVDALPGGLLAQLPDRRQYATVWRHGLDLFAATPVVRAPLDTRLNSTVDLARTWYDFPHHRDTLVSTTTLTKFVNRRLTLTGGYSLGFAYDVYPTAQAVFYPAPSVPFFAPDGTPWPGFSAYSGAASARGYTLAADYQSNDPNTSLHLFLAHANDFPQFHGYGRAPYLVSFDARLRPLPNIGIDVGRSYYFGWGGRRFSQWTFSVLP